MKVTIIGTGNMAKGIGTRFIAGKHEVTVTGRDVEKAAALASELGATTVSYGGDSDTIVVLAVPYGEIAKIGADYQGFAGKVVIDITNPVDFNTFQLIPEPGRSGAEEVAALFPEATVIKAFNTTLAGTLLSGKVDGHVLDVFVAGDNAEAKKTVGELVKTSGMRSIDVGALTNSRHLEGFGLIQIAIQDQIDTGWMSALKFLG